MNTFICQSGRHTQRNTDIYRETHHTISCITRHIVVELGNKLLIALCSGIKQSWYTIYMIYYDCLSVKGIPSANVFSYDLDLVRRPLVYELDLFWRCICILKMTFLGQGFQKLEPEQVRHTQRETDTQTAPNALPRPIRVFAKINKRL